MTAAAAAAEGTLLRRGSVTSHRGLLANSTSHASASVSGASGSGCSAICEQRKTHHAEHIRKGEKRSEHMLLFWGRVP
jgi:hypothetical protein